MVTGIEYYSDILNNGLFRCQRFSFLPILIETVFLTAFSLKVQLESDYTCIGSLIIKKYSFIPNQRKHRFQLIALAILFLVAPTASNDLTRRSSETVGSPFSIFATLDWLELSIFAN